MDSKQIQKIPYYLEVETSPERVVKLLQRNLRDHAIHNQVERKPNIRFYGGPYSEQIEHRWKFPNMDIGFTFSYIQSTPGSMFSGYNYRDIQGVLIHPEGLESSTLQEIDSLLGESGLNKEGKITKIEYEARQRQEAFRRTFKSFNQDLRDLM